MMARAPRGDTIHIRPDDAMYERIVKMARAERRSLANMVLFLLDTHHVLKTEPKPKLNGHASHKGEKAAAAT